MSKVTEWAEIFTHPIALNQEVTKNWHAHETEIRANVKKAQADWIAGKCFDAGKDFATVVDLFVPFPNSHLRNDYYKLLDGCYADPNHPAGYRIIKMSNEVDESGAELGTCSGSDTGMVQEYSLPVLASLTDNHQAI